MIQYDKFITIKENRYTVRTDELIDLPQIVNTMNDVNTIFVLIVTHGHDVHPIDIGMLFVHHTGLFYEYDNVFGLIGKLTPEMIYSYRCDLFNQDRYVRSFMSHDLPGETVISPYNINTGEMTNTSYDTNYKDVVIHCSQYNLERCVPVIDGMLRYCRWNAGVIQLPDRVNLVRTTKDITFLSFRSMDVMMMSMRDLMIQAWSIEPGYIPVVVIYGSLFYDNPLVYRIDKQRNKLLINESYVLKHFKKYGFDTVNDVLNDIDSFVIFVQAEKVIKRDVLMIEDEDRKGVYFEQFSQKHHLDYICIRKEDNRVVGISIGDEAYRHPIDGRGGYERHVYVDRGKGEMELIQLAAF